MVISMPTCKSQNDSEVLAESAVYRTSVSTGTTTKIYKIIIDDNDNNKQSGRYSRQGISTSKTYLKVFELPCVTHL